MAAYRLPLRDLSSGVEESSNTTPWRRSGGETDTFVRTTSGTDTASARARNSAREANVTKRTRARRGRVVKARDFGCKHMREPGLNYMVSGRTGRLGGRGVVRCNSARRGGAPRRCPEVPH